MYSLDRTDNPKKKSKIKRLFLSLIIFLVVLAAGSYIIAARWYNTNLRPVNEGSSQVILVDIPAGTSAQQIGVTLKDRELIRSESALDWYLRFNNLRGSLQAGSYELTQAMSVNQIIDIMGNGKLKSENYTILPGFRLDQLKDQFLAAGFSTEDVESAFNTDTFNDHPISEYKPVDASLEGYIFPETFERAGSTTAVDIIRQSLDQMDNALTLELRRELEQQGLSVHDAVILSSIVEKEVSNLDDKPKVAQVFLKRLREGIQLGSDVTFFYASAVFGGPALPSLDNPYNTRLYGGLPPGPISNFSLTSIEAVANPSDTPYLYFVAGDNGITYFNETLQGHNSDAATYCIELCKL